MDQNHAGHLFATLGHPGRLAVFPLLARFAPQGTRPTEIASALGPKRNAVLHHLADRLTPVKPQNWGFFTQPPAVLDLFGPDGALTGYTLSPHRENVKFTDQSYYTDLLHGQTRNWIRNMLQNQIGRIFAGRSIAAFPRRCTLPASRWARFPARRSMSGLTSA